MLVFILFIYMIGSFSILSVKDAGKIKFAFLRQMLLVLFFHAFGYAAILMHEQNLEVLAFYLVQVVFMLLYVFIFTNVYRNSSRVILSHMMMLLVLSFIILTRLDFDKALKQFLMVIVAATLTLVVPKMFARIKTSGVWAVVLGIIGFMLLLVVLMFSSRTYGASLSLNLGFITFQPSEFVKISFVLLVAVLFKNRQNFKAVLFSGVIALLHIIILIASTDLGGAAIYAFSYLFMVYTVTEKPFYLIGGLFAGAGVAVLAYKAFSHVRTRVDIFLDPWPLFSGKGNQVCNSLLGMASGGFWGTGLYMGSPELIPVVEKDFIFSAIVEEMGAVAGVSIILISLSCTLKFIQVSAEHREPFYRTLGIGLTAVYAVQTVLTIGGNIKFIPATGVTLPLVSYGGSSVFSTFILFSIMQELFVRAGNREERMERIEGKKSFKKEAKSTE